MALIEMQRIKQRRAGMTEDKKNTSPRGELTLRTLAMPGDTNAAGDIFGGSTIFVAGAGTGAGIQADRFHQQLPRAGCDRGWPRCAGAAR